MAKLDCGGCLDVVRYRAYVHGCRPLGPPRCLHWVFEVCGVWGLVLGFGLLGFFFFFQAEDGIRDWSVTGSSDVCSSDLHTSELQSLTNLVCRLLLGVQTCADRKSVV